MTPRLITDQMVFRALLRRRMQPDASRLACCFWWPTHQLRDVQLEMRLCLVRLLRAEGRSARLDSTKRSFADDVLQEAIDRLGEVHDAHYAIRENGKPIKWPEFIKLMNGRS